MAEPDSEMEEHRYSHLMSATQKREFRETFVLFDYDTIRIFMILKN